MIRQVLAIGVLACAAPAVAHHGWSSFDQDKPLYLKGTLKSVRWSNPHAEAVIQVAPDMALPANLASREMPKQSASVDATGIVKKTQAPASPGGEWQLEFAPLSRMQAWGLGQAPKVGDTIEVVGYTAPNISGGRLMRVEYVFYGDRSAALRSSPAN